MKTALIHEGALECAQCAALLCFLSPLDKAQAQRQLTAEVATQIQVRCGQGSLVMVVTASGSRQQRMRRPRSPTETPKLLCFSVCHCGQGNLEQLSWELLGSIVLWLEACLLTTAFQVWEAAA